MSSRTRQPFAPALLHPVALLSTVLLWFNDHWLKLHFPGAFTGKLSDVCGMVFFPLLLLALVELGWWLSGSSRRVGTAGIVAACVVTGGVFAAINLMTAAAEAYRLCAAVLWIPAMLVRGSVGVVGIHHTMDPTDLLALPALLVAYLIAVRAPMRAQANRRT